MRTVRRDAASDTKVDHTQTALVRAQQRPDLKPMAEKWLAEAVETAMFLKDKKASAALSLTVAQGEYAVGRGALLDVVCMSHEFCFNAGGRHRQDPLRKATFIDPAARLKSLPPDTLLEAVGQLADRIEATSHPKITKERAKEEADKIRASRDALAPKAQALALAKASKQSADKAYASAANRCQLGLGSFKLVMRAEKMSEAAIHEIIPGYSGSPRRRTTAATTPAIPPLPQGGPSIATTSTGAATA